MPTDIDVFAGALALLALSLVLALHRRLVRIESAVEQIVRKEDRPNARGFTLPEKIFVAALALGYAALAIDVASSLYRTLTSGP